MKLSGSGANFGTPPSIRGANVITVTLDGNNSGSGAGDNNESWIASKEVSIDAGDSTTEGAGVVQFGGFRGVAMRLALNQKMAARAMKSISSVYLDAADLPGTVQLTVRDSGQRITIPGGYQGWFPIIASKNMTSYDMDVSIFDIWSTWDNTTGIITPPPGAPYVIRGGVLTGTTVFGKLRMMFTDIDMPAASWPTFNPMVATWIDQSSTIAAGGAYQICMTSPMAVNAGMRYGLLVQNPIAAVEPLYLFFANQGSALLPAIGNSISLAPGKIWREMGHPCSQAVVTIMAATLGHAYIAKELK